MSITPFLWFDGQAEEAAQFYTSIFKNSSVTEVVRSTIDTPGAKVGSVLTVAFELNGQKFVGLNGGPQYKFNPAVSFLIECADQAEVDYYWDKLTQGGQEVQCGWLTDRYGVSWQVTPKIMLQFLTSPDAEATKRAMNAMITMIKLDVKALQDAYDGRS